MLIDQFMKCEPLVYAVIYTYYSNTYIFSHFLSLVNFFDIYNDLEFILTSATSIKYTTTLEMLCLERIII